MQLTKLPSVAKSFVMFCPKCEGDKFHTVITHLSPSSAKVVCDICKKKSTFKLGSDKPKFQVVKKVGATVAPKSRPDEHLQSYQKLIEEVANQEALTYSIKGDFKAKQKLNHIKFGVGVVTRVLDDRVEVVFSDEVRQLVHRRI